MKDSALELLTGGIVLMLFVSLLAYVAMGFRSAWKRRVDASDTGRSSRVLRAALAGDAAKLREAVDSGDDVNAWDENGMTPLLSAVFIGDREAVRLLLSVGADPNRPSKDDPTDTPLWRARDDFGFHEIADLLIQAGAENRSA